MQPYVETHNHGHDRTVHELKCPRRVGIDFDVDLFATARLGSNGAGVEGPRCQRSHTTYRPQCVNQGRQVVRTHVKQRTATLLVIERGVGMP